MEKAGYDNLIVVDYEIDCVRESPEQATSEFVVNFLVNVGVSGNIRDTGIKHSKKLFTKSRRFQFIPRISVGSIIFDFWQKAKGVCHFLFSTLALRSSRDRRVPGAD